MLLLLLVATYCTVGVYCPAFAILLGGTCAYFEIFIYFNFICTLFYSFHALPFLGRLPADPPAQNKRSHSSTEEVGPLSLSRPAELTPRKKSPRRQT